MSQWPMPVPAPRKGPGAGVVRWRGDRRTAVSCHLSCCVVLCAVDGIHPFHPCIQLQPCNITSGNCQWAVALIPPLPAQPLAQPLAKGQHGAAGAPHAHTVTSGYLPAVLPARLVAPCLPPSGMTRGTISLAASRYVAVARVRVRVGLVVPQEMASFGAVVGSRSNRCTGVGCRPRTQAADTCAGPPARTAPSYLPRGDCLTALCTPPPCLVPFALRQYHASCKAPGHLWPTNVTPRTLCTCALALAQLVAQLTDAVHDLASLTCAGQYITGFVYCITGSVPYYVSTVQYCP